MNGGPHAMVLDKIFDGKFVFKNTYVENKQLKLAIDADEAPEDFFFLHINYTPSSLKNESCRKRPFPFSSTPEIPHN